MKKIINFLLFAISFVGFTITNAISTYSSTGMILNDIQNSQEGIYVSKIMNADSVEIINKSFDFTAFEDFNTLYGGALHKTAGVDKGKINFIYDDIKYEVPIVGTSLRTDMNNTYCSLYDVRCYGESSFENLYSKTDDNLSFIYISKKMAASIATQKHYYSDNELKDKLCTITYESESGITFQHNFLIGGFYSNGNNGSGETLYNDYFGNDFLIASNSTIDIFSTISLYAAIRNYSTNLDRNELFYHYLEKSLNDSDLKLDFLNNDELNNKYIKYYNFSIKNGIIKKIFTLLFFTLTILSSFLFLFSSTKKAFLLTCFLPEIFALFWISLIKIVFKNRIYVEKLVIYIFTFTSGINIVGCLFLLTLVSIIFLLIKLNSINKLFKEVDI